MTQQETFGWLVDRHKELIAVTEAAVALGIEAPECEGSSWWVQAEPGPIECDTLAEAIKEVHDRYERECASLRAEVRESGSIVALVRAAHTNGGKPMHTNGSCAMCELIHASYFEANRDMDRILRRRYEDAR